MPDVTLIIRGKNLSKAALQQLRAETNATAKSLQKLSGGFVDVEETAGKAKVSAKEAGIAIGAFSAVLGLAVKSSISAAIKFERMMRALQAVSGSAEAAKKQLIGLRKVALLPGLTLEQALQGSVSLQAVGFSAKEAERALMAFGNALVVVGKGAPELSKVVLALSQIRGHGRLLGQELRQLTEQLPQVRSAMQRAFGTSTSEELLRLGVDAETFISKIVEEFEKLPTISDTAANAIENFGDSLFIAKSALASVYLPALKDTVNAVSDLLRKTEDLSDTQKRIVSWGIAGVTAFTAVTSAALLFVAVLPKLAFLASKTAVAFGLLQNAMIWLYFNPAVAIAGLVALAAGITFLALRSRSAEVDLNKLGERIDELAEKAQKAARIRELADRLDELQGKAEASEEELSRLKEAQDELIQISPTFISKFKKEGKEIELNTDRVRKFAEAMERTTEAYRATVARDLARDIALYTEKVGKAEKEHAAWNARLVETNRIIDEDGKMMTKFVADASGEITRVTLDMTKVATTQRKEVDRWSDEMDKFNEKLDLAKEKLATLRGETKQEEPGAPTPTTPIKFTEEEVKVFEELEKAKIAGIEHEYKRRIELANHEHSIIEAQAKKQMEDIRLRGKQGIFTAEAVTKKLEVQEAILQTSQVKRNQAIRDAEKDRIDEINEAYQELERESIAATEDRYEQQGKLALAEFNRAESMIEAERIQIHKAGLEEAKLTEELGKNDIKMQTERLKLSNALTAIQKEQEEEILEKKKESIQHIADISRIANSTTFQQELTRYSAAEQFAERIRASKQREIADITAQHRQQMDLLALEAGQADTTAERQAQITEERKAREANFIQFVVAKSVEMERGIAEATRQADSKTFAAKMATRRALATAEEDQHKRDIELAEIAFAADQERIKQQILDQDTLPAVREELLRKLEALEEAHKKKITDIVMAREQAVQAAQFETARFEVQGIKNRTNQAKAAALLEYDIEFQRIKDLENLRRIGEEEGRLRRFALAEALIAKLDKIETDAAKRRQAEADRTFAAWATNEDIRISLIDDDLKRELQFVKLAHEARMQAIRSELSESEISAERRLLLERQLHLEQQAFKADIKQAIKDESAILSSLASDLAAIPFDLARAFLAAGKIEDEHEKKLSKLHRERQDEIAQLRHNEELSAYETARQVEAIERESAKRRVEIEREMYEQRKAIFTDFLKSIFTGTLQAIMQEAQERLADVILDTLIKQFGKTSGEVSAPTTAGAGGPSLAGGVQAIASLIGLFKQSPEIAATGQVLGPPAPTQSGPSLAGGIGALASIAGAFATGNPLLALNALPFLMSFDNPANDAVARRSGANAAMLRGMSFDDPMNDALANRRGLLAAAKKLGQGSAKDVVDEFETGFVQAANQGGDGNDGKLARSIDALTRQLDEIPRFILEMDSKPLRSRLKRKDARANRRDDSY